MTITIKYITIITIKYNYHIIYLNFYLCYLLLTPIIMRNHHHAAVVKFDSYQVGAPDSNDLNRKLNLCTKQK